MTADEVKALHVEATEHLQKWLSERLGVSDLGIPAFVLIVMSEHGADVAGNMKLKDVREAVRSVVDYWDEQN
jgi:hypothetical protein